MATYISLIRFTEQGARNIKDSVDRAFAFDQLVEKSGVEVKGQYWTLGGYDGVLILEADNADTVLHSLTELVSDGNVTLQTLTAFESEKFKSIVG